MIYDLVLSHRSLLVTALWLRALPLFSSLSLLLFLCPPLSPSFLALPLHPPSLPHSVRCALLLIEGPELPLLVPGVPCSALVTLEVCVCVGMGVHVYGCVLGHVRGVTHMILQKRVTCSFA